MTDVFISYKREERDKAEIIAKALSQRGYNVWWDVDLLPGEKFAQEIREIIRNTKTAIVLWSKKAVTSPYVIDEATISRKRGILIPVRIEDCEIPIGFGGLHTLDLTKWQGDTDDEIFNKLIKAIEKHVDRSIKPLTNSEHETITTIKDPAAEARFWREISEHEPQSREEYELYLSRFGKQAMFSDIAYLRIEQLSKSTKEKKNFNWTRFITISSAVVGLLTAVFTMFLKGGELLDYLGLGSDQAQVESTKKTEDSFIDKSTTPIMQSQPSPPPAKTNTIEPPIKTDKVKPPITVNTQIKPDEKLIPFEVHDTEISLRVSSDNKKRADKIISILKNKQVDVKVITLYSIPPQVANKIYYSHKNIKAAKWIKKELENIVPLELVQFDAENNNSSQQIRINIGSKP